MGRARPDANNNFSLIAVSSSDGNTPVELWANPVTHALIEGGGSGGGLPSSVISGQQAITGSAVALPSNALMNGFLLESLSTNSISIFWGPTGITTSTGVELLPGGSIFIPVSNTNAVYVVASTTGTTVTFGGN